MLPPADIGLQAATEQCVTLIGKRLAIMPDVARRKWNSKGPVVDERREETLLLAIEERAAEQKIDRAAARNFFAAQIDASKKLQLALVAEWEEKQQPKFDNAPELATLRHQIDEVDAELLSAFGSFLEGLKDQRNSVKPDAVMTLAREKIDGEGCDDAVRELAIAPLVDLLKY